MASPFTATPFLALDEATYASARGECYHGLTARTLGRNTNALMAGLSQRPLVSQSWPVPGASLNSKGAGYCLSAINWKPIAPAYRVWAGPFATRATLDLYAKVENGYTVYAWAGPEGVRPPGMTSGDDSVLTLVGDGTYKHYPAGTRGHTFRVRPGLNRLVVWMGSGERIDSETTKDGSQTYGTLTATDMGSATGLLLTDPAGGILDATQLDLIDVEADGRYTHSDHYAYLSAAAGGNPATGGDYRRIRAAAATGLLLIDGRWNVNPGYWCVSLCRGPRVQIANLWIQERVGTAGDFVAGRGAGDDLYYAQQKHRSTGPAVALSVGHALELHARRQLVADACILPREPISVSDGSYTELGRWPVEFSRRGSNIGVQFVALVEATSPTVITVRVQTETQAGASTVSEVLAAAAPEFSFEHAQATALEYQIESRFVSPGAREVRGSINPTINEGDVTTYRQIIKIEVGRSFGTGQVRLGGFYAWEEERG